MMIKLEKQIHHFEGEQRFQAEREERRTEKGKILINHIFLSMFLFFNLTTLIRHIPTIENFAFLTIIQKINFSPSKLDQRSKHTSILSNIKYILTQLLYLELLYLIFDLGKVATFFELVDKITIDFFLFLA